MKSFRGRYLLIALAFAGGAGASSAQAPGAALDSLELGLWELRQIGPDGPATRMCLSDVRQFLQPMNPWPLCPQFIGSQSADRVTASYDCMAGGQGHTTLRIETPRLVQIESQGVTAGRPFATRLEGRHIGRCSSVNPKPRR